MPEPSPETDRVARAVLDAAFLVHRALGPGHKEAMYVEALERELRARGHVVECERTFRVLYRGRPLDTLGRVDMIIDDRVVVEAKAAKAVHPFHKAQALSYLRISGKEVALLINFNTALLKDGITRLAMTSRPRE